MPALLDKSLKISYAFFVLLLALTSWLHLTTTLVAALFSLLALQSLSFGRRYKWRALVLFLVMLAGLFYGFAYFINHALVALPEIASTSIPVIVRYATEHGIELPFSDVGSLKSVVMDSVQTMLGYLGNFAKLATKEFVFLIVGVVVAVGIFIDPKVDPDPALSGRPNLYSLHYAQLTALFRSFYLSFKTVMGAQVIISIINTLLTAIFVYACSLHYALVIIAITFLCGLLPVIGNIISNTVIVCIAFTVSPQFAGWALLFLITIHKLEYFLNSKIIGSRIKHPMWLTLIALILGERLFGIAGIILAPVVLNFIKIEASRFVPPPHTNAALPAPEIAPK